MASPNPSSSDSSTYYLPPVTQEEFKMFHNIDRKLFSRLVLSLSREIGQSMQVIAFLLWLEHAGYAMNLIHQMNSLQDYILVALVDEVVLCLKCIESLVFDPNSKQYVKGVPLVENVTKNAVSITYFRENRIKIINEVARNMNDVCVRAFDDIVNHVQSSRQQSLNQVPYYGPPPQKISPSSGAVYYNASALGGYGPPAQPNLQQRMAGPSVPAVNPNLVSKKVGSRAYRAGPSVAPRDPNVAYNKTGVLPTRSIDDDISEALGLSNIRTGDDHHRDRDRTVVVEEDAAVQPDDRTIFLTFSKGYPISENEVKEFFTGMIGDCLESIYMQEVPAGEQPLYARLVVPSESVIEAVLDGRSKAKFSINGKHVWARKYVRKNMRSANSPPSQPSSPVQAS
ncbi:hypothetical protein HS088_TW21G01700 [Tripterygium wilfordii]|uniref:RRM domain-containing protein n=1 Tax=Tripterygium wilfordii TaxID=458696 RepID=A0A7J7C5V7_TRIWF|nr:uncharacterized protein LOC119988048 [Tripterygium wilfordii]KAF5729533.1 hypothetical protein HS088_TW21G01700 [Tripterygium wilfordii]